MSAREYGAEGKTVGEFATGGRYLLGAFFGIAGGFASLYAYSAGIFIEPLVAEFGWTRTQASLSTLAIPLATIVAAPIAGRLVDRVGVVRVAIPSMIGLALGFAAVGTGTRDLSSFIAMITALVFVSAASTPLSFNRIVVAYFRERRGLALGIALTGTGAGAIFIPPLLTAVIPVLGWRAGYFMLSAVAFVSAALAWRLLRGSDNHSSRPLAKAPTSGRVFRTRAFATIGAIIFFASSAVLGTMFHFVPMLVDRGIDPVRAGVLASLFGAAVIGGRVATGYLLDIGNAAVVIAVLLLLSASGMFVLGFSDGLVVIGAILVGFGLGTEGDLMAYLLSRRFPLHQYSSAYGGIFAIHSIGGSTGPILAGYLYDRTGGYQSWLLVGGSAMILAAVIALVTEYRVPSTPRLERRDGPDIAAGRYQDAPR